MLRGAVLKLCDDDLWIPKGGYIGDSFEFFLTIFKQMAWVSIRFHATEEWCTESYRREMKEEKLLNLFVYIYVVSQSKSWLYVTFRDIF